MFDVYYLLIIMMQVFLDYLSKILQICFELIKFIYIIRWEILIILIILGSLMVEYFINFILDFEYSKKEQLLKEFIFILQEFINQHIFQIILQTSVNFFGLNLSKDLIMIMVSIIIILVEVISSFYHFYYKLIFFFSF